jgi:opacity protein-like surface antigen
MGRTKTSAFAGALIGIVAGVTSAQAADPSMIIGAAPEVFKRVPAMVEEFGSGWYLRGDIGYRQSNLGSTSTTNGGANPSRGELDDAFSIGGGVGIKQGWFRADITADYMTKANYRGTIATADDTRTSIEGVVALANVYFDLGTWSGLTPYVGAGVGASNLWTKGMTSPTMPANTDMSTGTHWSMAWAVMAGASYQISARMLVDAGYRYIHMGEAATGQDILGNQTQFKDLTAHELRVGVRYLID